MESTKSDSATCWDVTLYPCASAAIWRSGCASGCHREHCETAGEASIGWWRARRAVFRRRWRRRGPVRPSSHAQLEVEDVPGLLCLLGGRVHWAVFWRNCAGDRKFGAHLRRVRGICAAPRLRAFAADDTVPDKPELGEAKAGAASLDGFRIHDFGAVGFGSPVGWSKISRGSQRAR